MALTITGRADLRSHLQDFMTFSFPPGRRSSDIGSAGDQFWFRVQPGCGNGLHRGVNILGLPVMD